MLCSENKHLIIFALVMLLLPTIANASFLQKKISDVSTCLDNQTLNTSQVWLNNTGSSVPITFTTNCTYGCNEIINNCHEVPALEYTVAFVVLLFAFLLLFRLIGR